MLSIFLLFAPAAQPAVMPAPAAEVLRWEVAAGCPDEAWVRARVDEFRGPNSVEGFEARASIVLGEEGFALDSHIETPAGRSELAVSDADCEALATAFALSIALALEPEVANESLEAMVARDAALVPPVEAESEGAVAVPEPAPEIVAEPELDERFAFETVPARGDAIDRPARRRAATAGWLQLGLAGGWGLGPGVDLPLRLSGGLRLSQWEASVGAVYLPPSSARSGDAELLRTTGLGARADVARVIDLPAASWELPLRICGEVGWLQGRGVEVLGARSANASWWALGLGGSLRWAVASRLFLALELDAQVQPGRPAFALEGSGGAPIHESSLFAFRAGLAVGTRFGPAKKDSVAHDQSPPAGTLEL